MNSSLVRFTWIVPDDGAASLTAYHLEVLHYDGVSFSVASDHCGDSKAALILANAYCEIPMTTLTA